MGAFARFTAPADDSQPQQEKTVSGATCSRGLVSAACSRGLVRAAIEVESVVEV